MHRNLVLRIFFVVFFQAEDGIRDRLRSRGLGDVYKRQAIQAAEQGADCLRINPGNIGNEKKVKEVIACASPVSYTHLTLPTT